MVFLSTSNLRTLGRAPKLLPLTIGPYRITKVLGKLNYELELPESMKRLHNRFHVSVLTPHVTTDQFPSRPPVNTRPPAMIIDKEEVYEIESILKHKNDGAKLKFLIHWKGYAHEEATWVPINNLKNCIESINNYEKEHNSKLKLTFDKGNHDQVPKPQAKPRTTTSSSSTTIQSRYTTRQSSRNHTRL
jgi:hypothetical protein